MDYSKLQNGSDIRGIASEGIEGQNVNLTDEAVRDIAMGFVTWLAEKKGKPAVELRIGVGRDSRISGPRIFEAAVAGMRALGADVFDCALASTPAMFMSTVTQGFAYDGAVMITASHLPFNRNGLKFFTKDGGLEKEDIARIIAIAGAGNFSAGQNGGLEKVDFMSVYAGLLADKIRSATGMERPLEGMHIVVDAGNGAGGFFVDQVLVPLGANTAGSQFLEPDGTFPNHIPNPEDQGAARAILRAVQSSGADLGIVFDTDVDRAGAMDSQGRLLNKNRLIAMMAAILLEEFPGTTIVTDSTTSDGLAKFIAAKGGIHHRFKRGYKNVINEGIRLNAAGQDTQLAIETSGHGALRENYFLDDGAYLMVKIIVKMAQLRREGKELFSLIAELPEPAEAAEARVSIGAEDFKAYGAEVIEHVRREVEADGRFAVAPDNYEGIRVSFGEGWFLVRMSLHEPLLPINIESDAPGGVATIAREVCGLLAGFDALELAPLKKLI